MELKECKETLIVEALKAAKLSTEGSFAVRAARLERYYTTNPNIDLAACSECAATSDASLPSCPFCGDDGAVYEDDTAVKKKTTKKTAKKAPAKKAPAKKAPAKKAPVKKAPVKKAPAKKAKKVKKAPAKKTASATSAANEHEFALAVRPKKKKMSPPTSAERKVVQDDGSVATVETAVQLDKTATVKDLDRQVGVVKKSLTDGASALHAMGTAIDEIHRRGLWALRKDENGRQAFQSFKAFCSEELRQSHVHAYRAINVSKAFTVEEIAGLSGNQARIMLAVPKEFRGVLLEHARQGASPAELSDRAKELAGEKIPPKAPPPKKAVTVALVPGVQTLDMFRRPSKGPVGDTTKAKPAKSLTDHPWAVLEFSNNVRMLIRMRKAKASGQLSMDVEFRRSKPSL